MQAAKREKMRHLRRKQI